MDESAGLHQDRIGEGQLQIEVQDHFDTTSTERKMRSLQIETLAEMSVPEMQMRLFDQGLEFTPSVTDDEDEFQENDELLMPNMNLLHSRMLSGTGFIKMSKKSRSSAALFLDEPDVDGYGEFDIMDRQRPSIQSRSMKIRRLNTQPCDMVFENHMQLTWEGDRAKKKLRKQAREDLRQLGLLDKKGKVSHKSKYSPGFSLGELEEQIKFLLQSSQER